MTSHAGRLYAAAAALLVFFVAWAVIAAHPWQQRAGAAVDPRRVALTQREHRLRHEAKLVQQIVDRRFVAYRSALTARRAEIASAAAAARSAAARAAAYSAPAASPSVRVVTLPPLVVTRTS